MCKDLIQPQGFSALTVVSNKAQSSLPCSLPSSYGIYPNCSLKKTSREVLTGGLYHLVAFVMQTTDIFTLASRKSGTHILVPMLRVLHLIGVAS